MKKVVYSALTGALLLASSQVLAQTKLLDIQHRWAEVNYTLTDDAQEDAFERVCPNATNRECEITIKAVEYSREGSHFPR